MAGSETNEARKPFSDQMSNEEILINAGLYPGLVSQLEEYGIKASVVGGKPYIDTSEAYHQVIEGDEFRATQMSSLPMAGKEIDYVTRNSDGVVVFHLNDSSGGKEDVIFSKEREMPDYYSPSTFTEGEYSPVRRMECEERKRREQAARRLDDGDLARLEQELESMSDDDEILSRAGLTTMVARRLADNGIRCSVAYKPKAPYVDTSNVFYQVIEGDGFRAIQMSSLPLVGKTIDLVTTASDGVTTFHLIDDTSGRKEVAIFSRDREMPNYYKPSSFK